MALSKNLKAWWGLDSTSGTTAVDRATVFGGAGYDGTLNNSPTWGSGKVGGSLTLSGASTQYVTLPAGVKLFESGSGSSAAFWIKFTTTNRGVVYSQGSTLSIFPFIFIDISGLGQTTGTISIRSRDDALVVSSYLASTSVINDGTWRHVVFTQSGTTPDIVRNVYIDGKFEATLTGITYGTTTVDSFYLGALENGVNGTILPLTASLDDVRLYSREVSAAEVYEIFQG